MSTHKHKQFIPLLEQKSSRPKASKGQSIPITNYRSVALASSGSGKSFFHSWLMLKEKLCN